MERMPLTVPESCPRITAIRSDGASRIRRVSPPGASGPRLGAFRRWRHSGRLLAKMTTMALWLAFAFGSSGSSAHAAEPPNLEEPLVIDAPELAKLNFKVSTGGLPVASGLETYTVCRSDHEHPETAEGLGWTFQHHPDLAAWRGRLYVGWNSCERDEDTWPSRELISSSTDGKTWSKPAEMFPQGVSTPLRMYFFLAPNGRMLVIAGARVSQKKLSEAKKGGIVVRELKEDHSLGDVFTLRPPAENAASQPPPFTNSADAGFVEAGRQLLADQIYLQQQDYGMLLDPAQRQAWEGKGNGKAMCFFERKDGALVGVGKKGWTTLSRDHGQTWSQAVQPASLITGMGKVWGQRTADGRYALIYSPDPKKRWPLAMLTSDDGITFRDPHALHGDLPTRRYEGRAKDPGASYHRGLSKWNNDGSWKDDALWMVYSLNKEEIRVIRAPLAAAVQTTVKKVPLQPISIYEFHDSVHHWRAIRDEGRFIKAEPDQPSYAPSQVREIVSNILLFQRPNGGWPKDYDMTAILTEEQKAAIVESRSRNDSSFDNGNLHSQVDYLARAYTEAGEPAWRDACVRGLDYIFAAQYPNGGFPQRYPKAQDFHAHITFNDGVMIGCMNLLKDAADREPHFAWLDEERSEKARDAVRRGVECILKCQIRVDGKLTGWCQQHDRVTYEARPGRTFELASICPQDSTETVEFLMRFDSPKPEIVQAVEGAVEWLSTVKLSGVRVETVKAPKEEFQRYTADYDRVVVQDAAAPPLWARHYEIGTNHPVFAGRDGVRKYAFAEIERERRTGTPWFGKWPEKLIDEEYPKWRSKLPAAEAK